MNTITEANLIAKIDEGYEHISAQEDMLKEMLEAHNYCGQYGDCEIKDLETDLKTTRKTVLNLENQLNEMDNCYGSCFPSDLGFMLPAHEAVTIHSINIWVQKVGL